MSKLAAGPRPDRSVCNYIGLFQEFLLEKHLLRENVYYLGLDCSGWTGP